MRPDNGETRRTEAEIVLRTVRVRGFRALHDVCVDLDSALTVLIGENNTGKTSFLEALETAFGTRRAPEDDLHLDRDGNRAGSVIIDLELIPARGGRFQDDPRVLLGTAIQRDDEGNEFVAIRCTAEPAADRTGLSVVRAFLPMWPGCDERADDVGELGQPPVDRRVMDLISFSLLDASRDLVAQLRDKRSAWGRLVADMDIPEATARDIEDALVLLGAKIIEGSSVLARLREDLQRLRGALGASVTDVSLAPLPHRVDELARAIDVHVTAPDSAPIPMRLQGMGSRSLAALMIFQAFIDIRVGTDLALVPHAISAFEEPEAHLHPQAQRAVLQLLSLVPGQKIVSTHSPHVVSGADVRTIRLMRREGPSTVARRSTRPMKIDDQVRVRRILQQDHGDILFCKVAVFCDGTTEEAALPVIARHEWRERPLEGMGVTIIGSGGLGHAKSMIPVLEDLGIPWLTFADGDAQGERDVAGIGNALGRDLDRTSPEIVMLPAGEDFEGFLLRAGYGPAARRAIGRDFGPDALTNFEGRRKDLAGDADEVLREFLRTKKGVYGATVAEEVLADIRDGAVAVAPELEELFNRLKGHLE